MLITNATPLPVDAFVAAQDSERATIVTAKATFDIDGELETQDPMPLFGVDEPTELGLLPADAHPRFDDAFEVIVLARAHADGGRPIARRLVSLTVGQHTRHLHVTGDRHWRRGRATEPVPFVDMPLTYEHAFGGRCDAYLDAESPLEVRHPLNALGRGFDPDPAATALREELRLPDGLPYVAYDRRLPNVEDPESLVTRPSDDPLPASWATVPWEIGLANLRVQRRELPVDAVGGFRAHPSWIVSLPEAGARIKLTGLSRRGCDELALPQLRVFFDTELARRELVPQRIVLLPEQRRLYVVYRGLLPFAVKSARVRLDAGWCPPGLQVNGSLS